MLNIVKIHCTDQRINTRNISAINLQCLTYPHQLSVDTIDYSTVHTVLWIKVLYTHRDLFMAFILLVDDTSHTSGIFTSLCLPFSCLPPDTQSWVLNTCVDWFLLSSFLGGGMSFDVSCIHLPHSSISVTWKSCQLPLLRNKWLETPLAHFVDIMHQSFEITTPPSLPPPPTHTHTPGMAGGKAEWMPTFTSSPNRSGHERGIHIWFASHRIFTPLGNLNIWHKLYICIAHGHIVLCLGMLFKVWRGDLRKAVTTDSTH